MKLTAIMGHVLCILQLGTSLANTAGRKIENVAVSGKSKVKLRKAELFCFCSCEAD